MQLGESVWLWWNAKGHPQRGKRLFHMRTPRLGKQDCARATLISNHLICINRFGHTIQMIKARATTKSFSPHYSKGCFIEIMIDDSYESHSKAGK